MIVTTRQFFIHGHKIESRIDTAHHYEVRKAREAAGLPIVKGVYKIHHPLVGAEIVQHSTGKRYVCRSANYQFYYTGMAYNALLIDKNGSSKACLVESGNTIFESDAVDEFWADHNILAHHGNKTCIYCNAEIANDDEFKCGTRRDYRWDVENMEHEMLRIAADHPHTVHDFYIKDAK